jgi:hypothetical protein
LAGHEMTIMVQALFDETNGKRNHRRHSSKSK